MKMTMPLGGPWESRPWAIGWEHTQAFDVAGDFALSRACLEFDGLAAGAEVELNGVDLGIAGSAGSDRFDVTDKVKAGRNELTVRSAGDSGEDVCGDVKLVSNDKVSISSFGIDPEIVGSIANVWILVNVVNHTDQDQQVLASIVIAQQESREKVEIGEIIGVAGGEIDAVIRIVDPTMWQPSDSDEQPVFHCLIGLQVEDEVMDVAAGRFTVTRSPSSP
jgi:hypothetical protein